MKIILRLFVIVGVAWLFACSGGTSDSDKVNPDVTTMRVEGSFQNTPQDDVAGRATLGLLVNIYFQGRATYFDVAEFIVTAPNGWSWSFSSFSGGYVSDERYVTGKLVYDENPNLMPLGGVWTAGLVLKNGQSSSRTFTLNEPGSARIASHAYLYSAEDWSPPEVSDEYVQCLRRFPADAYTFKYSDIEGQSITSVGLSGVLSSFLYDEPKARNVTFWLFDEARAMIGSSRLIFRPDDHSNTNIVGPSGEIALTSSDVGPENVDLARVKYIRVISIGLSPCEPNYSWNADAISVSELVLVE